MALSFGENLGVLGNIKLTDVKLVAGAFRTIASGSDTGSITVQRVEDGQIVYIQSEDRLIKASKAGATVNWSNFYFPTASAGAETAGIFVATGSSFKTTNDLEITGSLTTTQTGSFGIVQSEGLTANESVIVASDGKSLTSSDLISYDTANSRVGIGTTSPSVKLDIVGESSGETQVRMGQHSDDSDAPDVRLFKSRGSVSSPTAVNDNDNLAFFNSFAYNGSSYVQAGAFGWQADGTDGDSQFIINTRVGNSVATRLLINPVGDVVLTHNISGSSASTGSFGRVEATKFEGDGSEFTNVTSPITVKDEGINLTTEVSSIDFVGTGVTATTDGNNVTATIAGADLVNVFESDGNGDLQPSDSNNGISVFYEYDDNNDITTRT